MPASQPSLPGAPPAERRCRSRGSSAAAAAPRCREATPCRICALDGEARELFDLFLDTRGNLKDVQRRLGVSYPTARQRIEELFQKLEAQPAGPAPADILARVRKGELTVEQAEAMLRGKR